MTDDMEDLQDTYPGAGTFMFGDTEADNEALLAAVRAGKKTANCEALAVFADDPNSKPQAGRCDIAANWDGTPALVIRTTKVKKVPFDKVTRDMALAEGAANLPAWQSAHEAYFKRTGTFAPNMMLLFEHFEVVEDLADR